MQESSFCSDAFEKLLRMTLPTKLLESLAQFQVCADYPTDCMFN
jgi:hypothetical protein